MDSCGTPLFYSYDMISLPYNTHGFLFSKLILNQFREIPQIPYLNIFDKRIL